MAVVKKKKLYFTVDMAISDTISVVRTSRFTCTQVTNGTAGDRYGALLQDYAPVTAGTPGEIRRRRAVSAWFQCAAESQISDNAPVGTVIAQLDFVGGATADSATQVPNTSPGGVPSGVDPIFTRHFRVRLRATRVNTRAANNGLRGTVYVQRQHSIEV